MSLGQIWFVPGTSPGFLLILHSGTRFVPGTNRVRDKRGLSLGQARGRRAAAKVAIGAPSYRECLVLRGQNREKKSQKGLPDPVDPECQKSPEKVERVSKKSHCGTFFETPEQIPETATAFLSFLIESYVIFSEVKSIFEVTAGTKIIAHPETCFQELISETLLILLRDLVALYLAMRLRFGYGFESCDANGPRNVKNTNPAKHRAVFFPHFSLFLVRNWS